LTAPAIGFMMMGEDFFSRVDTDLPPIPIPFIKTVPPWVLEGEAKERSA